MTKLNVPKNSLLMIEQNKLSVISDKIVKIKKNSNGLKNINLYEYRSGRLILKEIAQIDLNPIIHKFLADLSAYTFNKILINKDGKIHETYSSFTSPLSKKITNEINNIL